MTVTARGLLPLLIFSACTSVCSTSRSTTDTGDLSRRLAELAATSPIPGFAVAVVTPDAEPYLEGFGWTDAGHTRRYDADTIQPVGSISKTIIGLAMAQLADRGAIDLDTPVDKWLPFALGRPSASRDAVTLRRLATHTAGIVDVDDTYALAYANGTTPPRSLRDFLENYLASDGRLYRREHFAVDLERPTYRYSNIGAALAALVIEGAVGESFDAFTTKTVFEPLGLRDFHWHYDEARRGRYTALFDAGGAVLPDYVLATYPDGSLRASARDLARYLQRLMQADRGLRGPVSTSAVKALWAAQFDEATMPAAMDANEPNRAMFWGISRRGWLRHTGGDPGYAAIVSVDREKAIGRVVLVNRDIEGPGVQEAVAAIVNLLNAVDVP